MDIAGLQDAITKLNNETLPKMQTILTALLDRAENEINADGQELVTEVSNMIHGALAGIQSIVDSVPGRAAEVIGAPSVKALLDGYELRIRLEPKA